MSEIPYKEILLLFLGTLSTFLIWRIQHQKDKIKTIESQLSDTKYKMYSELIYIIFDISTENMPNKKVSQQKLTERIRNIKRDMFLYAPDKIFKTFTDWTLELKNENNSVTHFKKYFELMKLVRKEMGQHKTKIVLDDFMLFYMQDKDEYQRFKEMYNW